MVKLRILTSILLIALICVPAASALDVTVDSRGAPHGDYATIAAGLSAVSGVGGTVTVNRGETGVYYEHDLVIPANVTLRGFSDGEGLVVIDADGLGSVLRVQGVSNVHVSGFHLRGAQVISGQSGGSALIIHNAYMGITVSQCVLSGNSGYQGGALYAAFSNAQFFDCEFSGNHAVAEGWPSQGCGGAIYAVRCNLNLDLCELTGNTADNDGGAAYLQSATGLYLRGATLTGNAATAGAGGALYVTGGTNGRSSFSADCSEILSNTAAVGGADGYITADDGLSFGDMNCAEYASAEWTLETGAQLYENRNPTVPCMKQSTAAFPYQGTGVSVLVAPTGSAHGAGEACLFDDPTLMDATVTVQLNNYAGTPLDGVAAEDVWLDGAADDLALVCDPATGRYGSYADGVTGYAGTAGQTTLSRAMPAGLFSHSARAMTVWGPVGKGAVAHPDGVVLDMKFNSPDLDGDFNVDLDDCIAFAQGYFSGEDRYEWDYRWDEATNLLDVVPFVEHLGEFAGEIRHPGEPSYTLEMLFDEGGVLTNCIEVDEFAVVPAYVMIRDYDGGPIHGFELGLHCSLEGRVMDVRFPEEGINFAMDTERYNVAMGTPYVPTGGDAVLMEMDVLAMPGDVIEFSIELPQWSSVPGDPAPVLHGGGAHEYYALVPSGCEVGEVVATINGGCTPLADFGDAPDAPDAFFPTLFRTTSAGGLEPGVHHLDTSQEWLGDVVTVERGARDPSDPDGQFNLIDGDDGDDGVLELYSRYLQTIGDIKQYVLYAKVKATVAPGAPDMDRWLYLLYDSDRNGQWSHGFYAESRNHRLRIPPGESRTYTMWLAKCSEQALPDPTTGIHPWLRATLAREDLGFGWNGAGALQYGETEDYDDVYYAAAPPGFEASAFNTFVPLGWTRYVRARLMIPAGSSMEFAAMDYQDHGIMTRSWIYSGADPSVIGEPDVPVGSFINGTGTTQFINIPITPIPIAGDYRIQTFALNLTLNGYDGPDGTGNLVWSTQVFCSVRVNHPAKAGDGFGELAFGGVDIHPADQPIPVYPEGGGDPLAYVVFGNDQPTAGTLSVLQLTLDEQPGDGLLPVVNLVDADYDVDYQTPTDEPLIGTAITGLYLTGYDDAMLVDYGIAEEDLEPYWAPFSSEESFDVHCPTGRMFCSGFDLDETGNTMMIHDPDDFGLFYLGASSTTGAPSPRRASGINYPNPFNPSTTIRYELAAAGRLVVEVYGLKGELIRTLVDEERPSGAGEVEWDGRGADGRAMPSGVYLYMIRGGGRPILGKMALVR